MVQCWWNDTVLRLLTRDIPQRKPSTLVAEVMLTLTGDY